MSDIAEDRLLAAAAELQEALHHTADYLADHHLRSPHDDVQPASLTAVPPLQTALSYEATGLGETRYLEVVAIPNPNNSRTRTSGEPDTLAVQLNGKAVGASLHAYLARLGAKADALTVNTIVRHTGAHVSTATSTAPTVVVSSRLLAAVMPHIPLVSRDGVMGLTVLMLPASYDVWNSVRADLISALHGITAPTTTTTTGSADEATSLRQKVFWRKWFVVWLLTSLVLSLRFKIQEVWQVRAWLVSLLHPDGDALYPSLPVRTDEAQHSPLQSESSPRSHVVSGLVPSLLFDDALFLFAVAQHAMNYNAWHYRRLVWRACFSPPAQSAAAPTPASGETAAVRDVQRWRRLCAETRRECERVILFLEAHNGDTSASSYLLFLFHTLVAAADGAEDSVSATDDAVQDVWRTLFGFTQREVRRHVEKGHESIWTLRLGLIDAALSCGAPDAGGRLGPVVRSGWTVEDELAWVSTYADGVQGAYLEPACGATPRQVWSSALTGTPACQAFLAVRYGVQLVQLLLERTRASSLAAPKMSMH